MVALQQWVIPVSLSAAVPSALPPALSPAAGSAAQGIERNPVKGTADSGPDNGFNNPVTPYGSAKSVPGSTGDEQELGSPVEDLTYSNPAFDQGPWPVSDRPGEAYGVVPDDGINDYAYAINQRHGPKGNWVRDQVHPGSNLISQSTDNAGWQQNTPSGRTGVRIERGQTYPGVDNFWYESGVRATTQRIAQGAGPTLAEYGGSYDAGGNLAYQTPAAPETANVPPATGVPSGNGLNAWGEF
jgi:hypothetical protein